MKNLLKMRFFQYLVIPMLMVIGLSGCAAQRHTRRGDIALSSGHPDAAVQHYEHVLDLDPDKARDPEFMAKLKRARRDAAMERGRTHAAMGQWDQAIAAFEQSLEIDPLHVAARNAIDVTRHTAADDFYRCALGHADQGRLDDAEDAVTRSLQYQPQNSTVQRALASLTGPENAAQGPAVNAYNDARELFSEERYEQAHERFGLAKKLAPYHLPARAGLYEASERLRSSRELTTKGNKFLVVGALDDAILNFQKALQIWPFNASASRLIADARKNREAAVEHVGKAKERLNARAWDAAIAEAGKALSLFPTFADAKLMMRRAKEGAAEAALQQGHEQLQAGQLAAAEAAFEKSLGYRPSHYPAREGLAAVDAVRAESARREDLPGQALLWFMDANAHASNKRYSAQIEKLRRNLQSQVTVPVAIVVRDAGNRRTADAVDLEDSLYRVLEQQTPPLLPLDVDAEPFVDLRIISLNVREEIVSSVNLSAAYEVETVMPNPHLHDLRHELAVARERLAHRAARHDALRHEYEHALKATPPEPPEHDEALSHLRNRVQVAHRKLRESRRDLERARHNLDHAPSTIVEVVVHHWPYERETFAKSGGLKVRLDFDGIAGADGIRPETMDFAVEATDARILNPNPEVGVDPDFLDLPADAWMRQELIAGAVEDLAPRILRTILSARVSNWQDEMAALRREGNPSAAVEAGVRAALVLETFDGPAADRLLDSLRNIVHNLGTPYLTEK